MAFLAVPPLHAQCSYLLLTPLICTHKALYLLFFHLTIQGNVNNHPQEAVQQDQAQQHQNPPAPVQEEVHPPAPHNPEQPPPPAEHPPAPQDPQQPVPADHNAVNADVPLADPNAVNADVPPAN